MKDAKEIADEIRKRSEKARRLKDDYQYFRDKRHACCKSALAFTRKVDWKIRLEVINELLGLYGTEGITGDWQNGYWCNIVAAYCNTGETYDLTVIHVRGSSSFDQRGTFIISSWGDWFEKNEKRYGLQ